MRTRTTAVVVAGALAVAAGAGYAGGTAGAENERSTDSMMNRDGGHMVFAGVAGDCAAADWAATSLR